MKELERTVFAAITATLLTSPTFAKALHRNFETAPPRNSTKTSDAGNLGYNQAQEKVDRWSVVRLGKSLTRARCGTRNSTEPSGCTVPFAA
jgi:hypothetical protein